MNKGYENPPSEKTEHHYIGEYGGFNWIDLSDTAVESVDSSRETETVGVLLLTNRKRVTAVKVNEVRSER